MPFDWREYLGLARALQGLSGPGFGPEATARSAVSRAYYAAFGHARAYAVAHLAFVPSRDDHRDLRLHLAAIGFPAVASRLDHLRRWRNRCDYDAEPIELGIVPPALLFAQAMVDVLAGRR